LRNSFYVSDGYKYILGSLLFLVNWTIIILPYKGIIKSIKWPLRVI
jgi:hypothetical protein